MAKSRRVKRAETLRRPMPVWMRGGNPEEIWAGGLSCLVYVLKFVDWHATNTWESDDPGPSRLARYELHHQTAELREAVDAFGWCAQHKYRVREAEDLALRAQRLSELAESRDLVGLASEVDALWPVLVQYGVARPA